MNKEIKTDHFKTLNELLETCKIWIDEEDWYAYNRYFEMQCMKEMYKYIVELQKENEMLHHYKLLYQKVKERNDKAIEYVEKNKYVIREYTSANSGTKKIYEFCCEPDELLEILKGNNETKE